MTRIATPAAGLVTGTRSIASDAADVPAVIRNTRSGVARSDAGLGQISARFARSGAIASRSAAGTTADCAPVAEVSGAIFRRVQKAKLAYGSAPWSLDDGKLNDWGGGRGVYFKDPNGHVLELMTVPQ